MSAVANELVVASDTRLPCESLSRVCPYKADGAGDEVEEEEAAEAKLAAVDTFLRSMAGISGGGGGLEGSSGSVARGDIGDRRRIAGSPSDGDVEDTCAVGAPSELESVCEGEIGVGSSSTLPKTPVPDDPDGPLVLVDTARRRRLAPEFDRGLGLGSAVVAPPLSPPALAVPSVLEASALPLAPIISANEGGGLSSAVPSSLKGTPNLSKLAVEDRNVICSGVGPADG